MKTFITGVNGFLGSHLWRKWESIEINELKYNRYTQKKYQDLDRYTSEEIQIIHCGAESNKNRISRRTYVDNWVSVKEIVDFVANSRQARLIFISANSIGYAEAISEATDLYSHLKFRSEQYIKNNIDTRRYAIIRMPGIYKKNEKRAGFIDQYAYAKHNEKNYFTIRSQNQFNNMITIKDACDFINTISLQRDLPGYIGSCGTLTSASMYDICRVINKIRSSKEVNIEIEKDLYEPSPQYDVSKAVSLGLMKRDIIELIKYLYRD